MRRLTHIIRSFRHREEGGALVELGMVIPLFLVLIFGILDYGRLYWSTTMAQKAMQVASRLATVGPPMCGALPSTHTLAGSAPTTTRFGALCRNGGICAVPNLPAPCQLDTSTAYGGRIWDEIEMLLPPGSTPANVQFTYSHDTRLGFLGGPYTPVVTAEIVNLDFDFALPLGPLAALAASDPAITSSKLNTISIPAMSTSVPAEDLAVGAVE
ncbi:TadE/TadG family type IV pilus assembly protein [Ruegeria arenilitoris]|uniref:TadE/TadG family type IV pilus assembly protein n=1 Tax=Ruegeria arenilitoris TaxID=1173585 RepID=UPI00147A92FF|nr:TadE/TadG family type IV pilus assembly protein [Ruegeria arenilitoris]